MVAWCLVLLPIKIVVRAGCAGMAGCLFPNSADLESLCVMTGARNIGFFLCVVEGGGGGAPVLLSACHKRTLKRGWTFVVKLITVQSVRCNIQLESWV